MKKLLILAGILVAYTTTAQEKIIASEKILVVKSKALWAQKNNFSFDTIFLEENKFKLRVEEDGLDTNIKIRSVRLQIPGDKMDITEQYKQKEWHIGNDSAFVFTFNMGEQYIQTKDSSYAAILITYKLPEADKTTDTLVAKTDLLNVLKEIGKTHLVVNQQDSVLKKVITETGFKEQKEIHLIFYKRGIPKTELQKQVDIINKKLDDIFNQKQPKHAIGAFTLKDSAIVVYEFKEPKNLFNKDRNQVETIKSSEIDKVEIVVSNGTIRKKGLMVKLTNGDIYRNNKSPISIYSFQKRTAYRVRLQDNRANRHIEIGNFLTYNYSGKFHYPDDDTATLTKKNPTDSLFNVSNVNDLIDVTIYTDLLGLLGRKPNGIIQTQISGNFIINTNNLGQQDLTPVNFIKPYFRLAKLDSRFAQLDNSVLVNDTLRNRLYLNQISYLQAGVKLNIIRFGFGPNQQLLINGGADVNLTNADTLAKKDVTSINYYPEFEYKINGPENFGMELSARWLWQVVSKNAPFNNIQSIVIFNPQATVYYSPFGNPGNRIYIRYSNFAEIKGGKYNFAQFQFGYKTNLFEKK